MDRRQFVKQTTLTATGLSLGTSALPAIARRAKKESLVGIQVGPHSLYDEGIDQALDLMQETAGVNAVFIYATTYQGYSSGRSPDQLAPDHGIQPPVPKSRRLPLVWMKTHDPYYKETFMRHWQPTKDHEFAGRDIFAETAKPAEKRGIKVYARMLEGAGAFLIKELPGYAQVLTVDIYGQTLPLPCWNHPAYRAWWRATVRDLFESYPLAGLQWDAERCGPLAEQLSQPPWRPSAPQCFCPHCLAFGAKNNVDGQRAKEGFIKLDALKKGIREKNVIPPSGGFISVLRLFMEYPEVLSWERLWYQAKESLAQEMYQIIKSINPKAEFGRHISHQATIDPFFRASMDYAKMAPYADWLKTVVYHEDAADRFRTWALPSLRQSLLAGFTEDQAGEFLYLAFGFDPAVMPRMSDTAQDGFPPDYVFREVKRCVDDVAGKVPIYAGIGFDIPGQSQPTDTDRLFAAVQKSFEAGAKGLMISREYDEMRLPGLKAIGRAVRSL